MLSVLRNAANSIVGKLILGFVAIAMVVTLYDAGLGGGSSGVAGGSVASVAGAQVSAADIEQRIRSDYERARQADPTLDFARFVTADTVNAKIDEAVAIQTTASFAGDQGMRVSRRTVDGLIASIPAFFGITGSFDRNVFLGILNQRKMTEAQVRNDIEREALRRMVLAPAAASAVVPQGVVAPYARMLTETRTGAVAAFPTTAFGGAKPDDKAVDAWYRANLARYTTPERRIIRYAVVTAESAPVTAPTDAEVVAYYQKNSADYAGRETRSFTQVIVPSEAAASAIAGAVKGGKAFDAAVSGGPAPITVDAKTKSETRNLSSAGVADAIFGAAKGAVVGPMRSPLGWHVARVDTIATTPPRSLDTVRPAITATLAQAKRDGALRDLAGKIDDEVTQGATFDEVLDAFKLSARATPPVTAEGRAPGVAGFAADAALGAVLKDAFQVNAGDQAAVTQLEGGKAFAFWQVDRVTPAAPVPLAEIRPLATNDLMVDQAFRAARRAADAAVAKVASGTPLRDAVAATGRPLPPVQPAGGRRLEVMQGGDNVPAPVRALFALTPGKARVLPLPGNQGFYVVALDRVTPATDAAPAGLVDAMRAEMRESTGSEYAQQLVTAIGARLKTTRDPNAAASIRARLAGDATPAQ